MVSAEKDLRFESSDVIRSEIEHVEAKVIGPFKQRLVQAEARSDLLTQAADDYRKLKERWLKELSEPEWARIINAAERAKKRKVTSRWQAENPTGKRYRAIWDAVKTNIHELGSDIANDVTPGARPWATFAVGISEAHLRATVDRSGGVVDLVLNSKDPAWNIQMFESLVVERDEIQRDFGNTLVWDAQEGSRKCRLRIEKRRLDLTEEDDVETIANFLAVCLVKLHEVFRKRLRRLRADME